MTETTEPIATGNEPQYKDDDLVYVDPKERVVVGRVEFDAKDIPKPLAMKTAVEESDDEEEKPAAKPGAKGRVRKPRVRYYPWGTYRSMKKIYKIEGKIHNEPPTATLDEIMEKALKEPYWN